MDNNSMALLSAEKRQEMLEKLRRAEPLELLVMAASFVHQDTDALEDVIQSGWIRLFFTEWQIQLKQFTHRFTFSDNTHQLIRIIRGREASGLRNELETIQVSHLIDDGYFLDEKAGTLNIQTAFPKSYARPYYQLYIKSLKGYLVDFYGDFSVEIDAVRDVNDPAAHSTSADALIFAQQYGELLQQSFAAGCMPQSLTVDELRERLNDIERLALQMQSLMIEAATVLPMGMWRVEVNVWFGDDTQTFSFFTPATDHVERVVTLQDGLLRVFSFDGIAGVFNRGDVESYAVIDVPTNEKIVSAIVCFDQEEQ